MADLYSNIEPFDCGMFDVGDGHRFIRRSAVIRPESLRSFFMAAWFRLFYRYAAVGVALGHSRMNLPEALPPAAITDPLKHHAA